MDKDTSDHILITASRVDGTPVFNDKGERIGHVHDLSIDKQTGQVRYALMSFGGFLGLGARIHPMPWSVLNYDTALEGFGAGDKVYRDALFSYYGQWSAMPYWGL